MNHLQENRQTSDPRDGDVLGGSYIHDTGTFRPAHW